MATIARLMITRPPVDPGCELSGGVAVGVGACTWARRFTGAAAELVADGDNASTKARNIASTRRGRRIRRSALFMMAVSISRSSESIHTFRVYFFAF